jgi:hypothetical protein
MIDIIQEDENSKTSGGIIRVIFFWKLATQY